MSAAFLLFIGLVGISPALILLDGLIVHALITGVTAIAVILVALSIRPGEGEYLAKIIRALALLAVLPALWMLVQLLPIPGLTHPIWANAREALSENLMGAVTIDRGATLIALTRFSTAAGLVFVAAAVTVDRARAETMLFMLSAVTTFAALALIGLSLSGLRAASDAAFASDSTLQALAALGVVINTAAADRAIERYETRRSSAGGRSAFLRILAAFVAAFLVCSVAVLVLTEAPIIFAASCGFASFLIIVAIRRLQLRLWEGISIAAIGLVIAGIVIATNWGPGDLTLRFAGASPSVPVVQSMLSNTGWPGNGAGSFASLLPVYQPFAAIEPRVPTTAAAISIELGNIALAVMLALALALIGFLLRGSLTRGRDSFFPTAATASVVMVMVEAFCDASLLASAVIVVTTATIGLGLAQSESRTAQVRY